MDLSVLSTLSVVDWALIAVMVLAAIGGLSRGFFRSASGLVGLVAGLVLAAWNYQTVAHFFSSFLSNDATANTVAFIAIALVVMIVAGILGSILANAVQKMGLGCLDRLAGGVFGLLQGALVVTLIVWVTIAFFPKAEWLIQSRVPRYFFGVCHMSTRVSPEQLGKTVRAQLKELEAKTPDWMHKDNNAR
ncbi:MAG TPA: CvpA family protein [Terracidiphilus sp.]